MGKRSNGTRTTGTNVSSSRSVTKGIVGKITTGVEKDLEPMRMNTKNAIGKLVGKQVNGIIDTLKDNTMNIKNVKSAMGVEQFADNISKLARKSNSQLSDLIDTLEHNNKLNTGVKKSTYNKAIDAAKRVRSEIDEKFRNGYKLQELGELQGYFMKKGKING